MYFLVSSLSVPPETARAMLEPISMAATAGRATAEATAKAGIVILNVYDHILESADGTVRLVREGTEGAIDITEASAEESEGFTHDDGVLIAVVGPHTSDVLVSSVDIKCPGCSV